MVRCSIIHRDNDDLETGWSTDPMMTPQTVLGYVKAAPTAAETCPMMTYRKLGEYVAAEPFRPFRIRMASGHSFDIRHPEMILVGRTSARVHTVTETDQNEKWHDASLLLMETVEPLDAPVSSKDN